jgi:signal peptidase I
VSKIAFRFQIVVVVVFFYLLIQSNFTSCPVRGKQEIVRGGSLSGIVENGATVKVLYGYYRCHKIMRDDIVIYNYAGSRDPLIKVVKGIPGDRLVLRQVSQQGVSLFINNQPVINSVGELYQFNEQRAKLLTLYIRDFQGLIPSDSYLILGNLERGTLDSSIFGFIAAQDVLGKVLAITKR